MAADPGRAVRPLPVALAMGAGIDLVGLIAVPLYRAVAGLPAEVAASAEAPGLEAEPPAIPP